MKTLRCAVVLLALAGCAVSATQPEIDMATETLSDLQKAYPGAPEFARYLYRFQRRIDQGFFEEMGSWHHSGGAAPGSRHSFSILVVVLADGRIGADDKDLKRSRKEEPVLTEVALRALGGISDHPEAFSAELVREIGRSFRYRARFYQR